MLLRRRPIVDLHPATVTTTNAPISMANGPITLGGGGLIQTGARTLVEKLATEVINVATVTSPASMWA
jgi:hypothetical protein